MSNRSNLPPKKKIRLSIPIASDSKFSSRRSNDDIDIIKIFEWKEENIRLLAVGYTRNNINFGIYDISSIIFKYIKSMLIHYNINSNKYSKIKYMSDNSIICNFNTVLNGPTYETILFTPYISHLFDSNNKTTHKMKITLKSSSMADASTGGFAWEYFVNFGLLCIPKNPINNKPLSIKKLKNIFENLKNGFNLFFSERYKQFGVDVSSHYIHLSKYWEFERNKSTSLCCIGTSCMHIQENLNYGMKENKNSVYVCVNRELNNNKYKYKLYFMGDNNEKIGNSIDLDNDKYDWLFAITSDTCESRGGQTYEFRVRIE